MNLFAGQERRAAEAAQPLAGRMRPRHHLDEFVGQTHILGPGKLLRRMIEADRVGSVVFCGPPGCGKTSLAELIARSTKRSFVRLNAVASGVKELRQCLDEARDRLASRDNGPSCSSTNCIGSTARSRTACCPTSKRE